MSAMLAFTARQHTTGVERVAWRPDACRPDMFLVAYAERADARWLRLADVVIHPAQPTVSVANELAVASLRRLSGCALVAVGVEARGCLLRCRDGHGVLVGGESRSPDEVRRWAMLGYAMMVLSPQWTTP